MTTCLKTNINVSAGKFCVLGTVLLGALALQGCSVAKLQAETTASDALRTTPIVDAARSSLDEAPKVRALYERSSTPWIGSRVGTVSAMETLPPAFSRRIVLRESQSLPIADIATLVSSSARIQVVVSEIGVGATVPSPLRLDYEGTVRGLFDYVSTRFGYSWDYKDNVVTLEKAVTRVFDIRRAPRLGGGTTGVSGSDGWEDLQRQVRLVMSSAGRLESSKPASTMAVTDTPGAIARVARLIESDAKAANRKLRIAYHLIAVSATNTAEAGLDLSWVLAKAAQKYGLTLGSPSSLLSGSAASGALTSTGTTSNGSAAVFSILSGIGNTRTVTAGALVSENNKSPTYENQNDIVYVQEVTPAPSGGSGTGTGTSGLKPGREKVGFKISVTPTIYPSDEIHLTLAAEISELIELITLGTTAAPIQTPRIARINFSNDYTLRNGEMVVMMSAAKDTARFNRRSTLPNSMLAGGSEVGNTSQETFVLLITPTITQ